MISSEKQRVHFVNPYLINPPNPITVNVHGAGGTGSHLVPELQRMNYALKQFGHAGLQVNLFDAQKIESPNYGRTTFNANQLGMNKAVAVININNGWFGTNWKAITTTFEGDDLKNIPHNRMANITISCVDDVQTRFNIDSYLSPDGYFANTNSRYKPMYWIDFGNSRNTGQVQFSTVGDIKQPVSKKFITVPNLVSITKEYGQLLRDSENNNTSSSCSFLESNESQDLFINSILATKGADMLWKMLRTGILTKRGFFENLEIGKSESIPI